MSEDPESSEKKKLLADATAPFQFVHEADRPWIYFLSLLLYTELANSSWESLSLLVGQIGEPLATVVFGFYWVAAIVLPLCCLILFGRGAGGNSKRLSGKVARNRWLWGIVLSVVLAIVVLWVAHRIRMAPPDLDTLAHRSIREALGVVAGALVAIMVVAGLTRWKRSHYEGGDPVVDFAAKNLRPTFVTSLIIAVALGEWVFLGPTLRKIETLKQDQEIVSLRQELVELRKEISKMKSGK